MTDDTDQKDRIDNVARKASPRFGRKKEPPQVQRPSAKDVLVELALDRLVSEENHQKIINGDIRVIVANVPDAGWGQPVARALSNIVDGHVCAIIRDKAPPKPDLMDQRLPDWAHAGEYIVGVAPDADRALPPLLASIVELRIDVPPADAELVAEVLRHCQLGDVPADALDLTPQVLSFDKLCSLIPQGGKATETVARLKSAIARKFDAGGRKWKSLPRLEDAMTSGWCGGMVGGSGVAPGQAESFTVGAGSPVKPLSTRGALNAERSRGKAATHEAAA